MNPEPIIFVGANCKETQFGLVMFNGQIFSMSRDNLVFLILATDIIVVISFMIFIDFINYQQNHFSKKFAYQTIEMNDFSVRIENLPGFDYHFGDETILKMKLWCHINNVVQNQIINENQEKNLKINHLDSKY